MTLTIERLKWLHDAATELSATKLKMTMRPDELLVLTSELLANREAQPVALVDRRPAASGGICWQHGGKDLPHGTELFTAPPAPANAQPAGYFVRHRSTWNNPSTWSLWTECSAEDYAEYCKRIATGEADAGRFYEARILYTAPPAPAIPDIGSSVVNDAAWKLHDTLTKYGPLNGHQFNHLKSCLYEALKIVMTAPPAQATPEKN